MTDVEEIVKEFYETRNMVDKLYDMVMEKRYYFKAKILENRNKVCNHIDEEFSKLLETEKGKEFKDYIYINLMEKQSIVNIFEEKSDFETKVKN